MEAFYHFIISPFESASLIGISAWLAAAAILFLIVKVKVIPEFYEAALMTGSAAGKQERVRDINVDDAKNLGKFAWRYHIRLLSEGSVVMQTILMSAVLPYLFIISIVMGVMRNLPSLASYLTPRFLLPMILLAVFIATLNSGGNNLTAIGISLERENFDYLKVLPFDLEKYIRLKFWYLFVLQSVLPVVLLLAVSLFLGVHPITLITMLLVWFFASLIWSSWGYHYDYKHLSTNWSNVTELLNRGNSMVKTLLALLITIGMVIAIAVLFFLSLSLPALILYLL
ncbi:hypothetical protein STRDD11_02145 [Streptococcus sp. DD11]|nr:hypothetical protein STRDD11_02145 [Streptococcus sp. DD11]